MAIGMRVPNNTFPEGDFGLEPEDEALIDIAAIGERRISVSPEYYKRGVEGAVPRCLLRQGAAERLLKALSMLPPAYGFRIYDAWRPLRVQKALYDRYYRSLEDKYLGSLTRAQIEARARLFVSPPSEDISRPAAHSTGGAVDLTITDMGRELDMGTEFDDFSDKAHSAYFEIYDNRTIRDNRRLLYGCMTAAGFTNLPTEWWHFDYGDAFWSCYTGRPAIYAGILSEEGGRIDDWRML